MMLLMMHCQHDRPLGILSNIQNFQNSIVREWHLVIVVMRIIINGIMFIIIIILIMGLIWSIENVENYIV